MSKTIIKIKTWVCPKCDYHQDFEPTEKLTLLNPGYSENVCPSCKQVALEKETRNDKKVTMTIMGEEDIDGEITEENEKRTKEGNAEMTTSQKTAYRTKRKKDIEKAITKAKTYEDK